MNIKAKLYKTEKSNYILTDPSKGTYDKGFLIGNSIESDVNKLSTKNCEGIANGYDLEELAEDWCMKPENNWSNNNNEVGDNYGSYKEGFQKALEIHSGKKFSELDKKIDSMVDFAKNHFTTEAYDTIQMFVVNLKANIQKIQQQTEWDVEIEMECPQCQEWGYISECRNNCNNKFLQPKLDSDGCLILKRV